MPTSAHGPSNRKAAFTLIELLVVIAIIAILAAILFPVFAQAKLAAKKSAGLSQMKQIGMAVMLYAGDHDDGLPTWDWYQALYPRSTQGARWAAAGSPPGNKRTWDAMLLPYVKDGSFDKAAAVASSEWAGIWKSPGAEYTPKQGRSIGINQLISWDFFLDNDGNPDTTFALGTGSYVYMNMGQMEAPADTMFVGDSGTQGRYEQIYNFNGHTETWINKPANGVPQYSTPWRYGKQSANYAWLDGHASSMPGDKIYPNPSKTLIWSSWPAAARMQTYCATAKYQAGRADMRQKLVETAAANGVDCKL